MKKEMRSARWLGVALTLGLLPPAVAAEVHQATGFKIVNVTSGPPMFGPASRSALAAQAESVRLLSR